MAFLGIEYTTKPRESTEVLHRVDVSETKGAFLALVSPLGFGKTTPLNMIAGLEDVTSGTIAIQRQPMDGVHPLQRNIPIQSYALSPNLTVGQSTLVLRCMACPRRNPRWRWIKWLRCCGSHHC